MNTKRSFIKRLLILTISTTIIAIGAARIRENLFSQTVRAFGDLRVDFGIPNGQPLFDIENMLPGDVVTKQVSVRNQGSTSQLVFVKGVKTGETQQFGDALFLTIREGPTDLYGGSSLTGPKTLMQFFAESIDPIGIRLSTILPGAQIQYSFIVNFPPGSDDNQYQGARIVFDLTFGSLFTFRWDTQVRCAYIENRVQNLNPVGVRVTGRIFARPDNGRERMIAEVPPPYQYAPPWSWTGPIENIRRHFASFRGVVWGTTVIHYQGIEVARKSFGPTTLRCR